MATLVLTTVGTLIGGPIGGLLGSVAGQAIDARVLGAKGRSGPRLTDLRIQTSSYGTAIPRLYGRMRVAGTVIWATDLVEHKNRSSAGKGQPKVTSCSYSASFAVALASRQISRGISGIERIWAEGNLLRGSGGDWKQRAVMRVHDGDADQAADPLIAAAEGAELAPAYRGIAYVVFEDLDLSPFGNRVPSLTFEVLADATPPTLGAVAADLIGDAVDGGGTAPITGYAAAGGSRVEAAAPLLAFARARRVRPAVGAGGFALGDDPAPVVALADVAADTGGARAEYQRGALARVPGRIALSHYDPARDFQLGVQQVRVAGGGRASEAIALPLSIGADGAKALAEQAARGVRAAALTVDWPTGFAGLLAAPDARVARAGEPLRRVAERRISGAMVRLSLVADDAPLVAGAGFADAGRALVTPDAPLGRTRGALFDLPATDASAIDMPRLVLAACGTGADWHGASVAVRSGPGAPWVELGGVGSVGVLGTVVAVSGSGTAILFDDVSTVEVELVRGDMALTNASDTDLLAGANLAMLGDELVQFGRAEQTGVTPGGAGRWRLSRLLRGRLGTDDGLGTDGGLVSPLVGRAFALLDDAALLVLPADAGFAPLGIGGAVRLTGTDAGDEVVLPISSAGRAQRPFTPVQLTARWASDGALLLGWVRRSRSGAVWRDAVDVPIDAPSELYRLRVIAGAAALLLDCAAPATTISAATLSTWRAGGAVSAVISVVQVGAYGESLPVMLTRPI